MTPTGVVNSSKQRGALIVFEGCDHSGKTTQCRLLCDNLEKLNIPVKYIPFPERSTNIGQNINAYLKNEQHVQDEVVHLLFAANRWEYFNQMKQLLLSGITLVVDRYSYSGVVYSTAKGLPLDWCMSAEIGLLRPDIVFYLKLTDMETVLHRNNFGSERFENMEFQMKVAKIFDSMSAANHIYWQIIQAELPIEIIQNIITDKAKKIIKDVTNTDLNFITKDFIH